MKLETNFIELDKNIDASTLSAQFKIQNSMRRLGIEADIDAKETVNTFVNSKGNQQGVDSGMFRDTIHSEIIESGFGFRLIDGVPYGIYHEFGTQEHFVPFVDEGGSLTGLGKWAVRHFEDIGFEAIGKSGKKLKQPSRKTREEIVKAEGGMMVSLDEMAPFRKALEHVQNISATVFEEEFVK